MQCRLQHAVSFDRFYNEYNVYYNMPLLTQVRRCCKFQLRINKQRITLNETHSISFIYTIYFENRTADCCIQFCVLPLFFLFSYLWHGINTMRITAPVCRRRSRIVKNRSLRQRLKQAIKKAQLLIAYSFDNFVFYSSTTVLSTES